MVNFTEIIFSLTEATSEKVPEWQNLKMFEMNIIFLRMMMTMMVMKTMMKVVMFFVLAAARSSSSSHHSWVLPPHRESPPCSCPACACLPADHHYHPPADHLGPSFFATLLISTPVDKKTPLLIIRATRLIISLSSPPLLIMLANLLIIIIASSEHLCHPMDENHEQRCCYIYEDQDHGKWSMTRKMRFHYCGAI